MKIAVILSHWLKRKSFFLNKKKKKAQKEGEGKERKKYFAEIAALGNLQRCDLKCFT